MMQHLFGVRVLLYLTMSYCSKNACKRASHMILYYEYGLKVVMLLPVKCDTQSPE